MSAENFGQRGIPNQGSAYPLGMNTTRGVTTGGDGRGNVDFRPWFGEPPKPIEVSPYEAYKRENFALPEAYHGKNYYMSTIMIQAITEDDMWATKIALPFQESNSMEIEWEEITFDRPLLGPVPEEGISRLVTASTAARRESHQRYGIAFTLEHGFMNTERGRRWYAGNIQQIKNAVLETAYQLVIEAYLRCKMPSQVWNDKYGTRTFHSIRDAYEIDVKRGNGRAPLPLVFCPARTTLALSKCLSTTELRGG